MEKTLIERAGHQIEVSVGEKDLATGIYYAQANYRGYDEYPSIQTAKDSETAVEKAISNLLNTP